jgi:hypothetical protein
MSVEEAPPKVSIRLTRQQRAELKQMFDGLCAYCGEELGDRWHADHVEPVLRVSQYVKGKGFVATGKMLYPNRDGIENMMPACIPCNIHKHGMSLEGWRMYLADLTGVLRRNHAVYRHALRFGFVSENPKPVVFYFERLRGASE